MNLVWHAEDILRAVNGVSLHEQSWQATGVAIDSRAVKKGDLFVALKGPTNDAHAYLHQAFENGAVAALVQQKPIDLPASACLVEVKDTFDALHLLGQAGRQRATARIATVTGSVGKTTTKELLKLLFDAVGGCYANEGSFNNHWGVPLSLARLPQNAPWGVFEIGMNHKDEITPLVREVLPNVALITNVEAVHLENFPNMEGIADAKAEIFQGLDSNGVAVLNADNPYFARLSAAAQKQGIRKILSFSEKNKVDARLTSFTPLSDGSEVEAEVLGHKLKFLLSLPGKHVAINAVAALLTAAATGADIIVGAENLAALRPLARRGLAETVTLTDNSSFTLIDETFNANPVAVRAALQNMMLRQKVNAGRRIAVLGDMRELGPTSPLLHANLVNELQNAKIDRVYCCGAMMAHLFEALPADMRGAHTQSSLELAPLVAKDVFADDTVLVKGSKTVHMEVVVDTLRALHHQKSRVSAI